MGGSTDRGRSYSDQSTFAVVSYGSLPAEDSLQEVLHVPAIPLRTVQHPPAGEYPSRRRRWKHEGVSRATAPAALVRPAG